MARGRSPNVVAALIIGGVVGLGASAGSIGWAIGHETHTTPLIETVVAAAPRPSGHSGASLPPHEFGDPVKGARLFLSRGCAGCHSYAGKGGTDAPPLDFMAGHLSAREVANMSGRIWNHMPAMLPHFKEEGSPFPAFSGYEMADLIAYLHSRQGEAPPGPTMTGEMQMGQ